MDVCNIQLKSKSSNLATFELIHHSGALGRISNACFYLFVTYYLIYFRQRKKEKREEKLPQNIDLLSHCLCIIGQYLHVP